MSTASRPYLCDVRGVFQAVAMHQPQFPPSEKWRGQVRHAAVTDLFASYLSLMARYCRVETQHDPSCTDTDDLIVLLSLAILIAGLRLQLRLRGPRSVEAGKFLLPPRLLSCVRDGQGPAGLPQGPVKPDQRGRECRS